MSAQSNRVLIVWGVDESTGGIVRRFSRDGGHTWSEPEPFRPMRLPWRERVRNWWERLLR